MLLSVRNHTAYMPRIPPLSPEKLKIKGQKKTSNSYQMFAIKRDSHPFCSFVSRFVSNFIFLCTCFLLIRVPMFYYTLSYCMSTLYWTISLNELTLHLHVCTCVSVCACHRECKVLSPKTQCDVTVIKCENHIKSHTAHYLCKLALTSWEWTTQTQHKGIYAWASPQIHSDKLYFTHSSISELCVPAEINGEMLVTKCLTVTKVWKTTLQFLLCAVSCTAYSWRICINTCIRLICLYCCV